VLTRQHKVENNQINGVRRQVGVHGLTAVDTIYVEPLLGKISLGEFADFRVVVDHEELGGFSVH
jgi:hypothetical protein